MFDFIKDINLLRPYIYRRDKWKFVILLVLMLIGACFEAIGLGAVPAFVTFIIEPNRLAELPVIGDRFSGLPTETTLPLVFWGSFALLTIYLLKNIYLIIVYYAQSLVLEDQRIKLSTRVFRAYQKAPYEWHLQRSSAELIRNIKEDTRIIIDQILLPFTNMIMSTIMTLVIIIVLVTATPGIGLISVVISGGGIVAVVSIFRKYLRNLGKINNNELKRSNQAVIQGFGAVIDARILRCQNHLERSFSNSMKRMAKTQRYYKTMSRSTPYILELLAIFSLLLVIVAFFVKYDSLQHSLPMLSLFAVSVIRIKQTMTTIASNLNGMNFARASIPNIVEDLKAIDQIEREEIKTKKVGAIKEFQYLHLKNVSYCYPNTEAPAIQNVSLKLKKGESIAFAGPTGCGKSTLVNMILGLLKPQSGSVEVNGINIQQDMEGWYSNIGYIPQFIYLIDDTLRANIAFGLKQSEINEEQVWAVLQTACLDDFVQKLPQKLDTVIGENGVRLSGGQRQRVGIARALYRNPAVVVMDEATSALDNETESLVMQAITNLRKDHTFIMIAHRLSTVENCDRLYQIKSGQIDSIKHSDSSATPEDNCFTGPENNVTPFI